MTNAVKRFMDDMISIRFWFHLLIVNLLILFLSQLAHAQQPYHGYPVQAGDGQYGDDTPSDSIPLYCRWGWSKCGPNGNIRRYHTREHCMAIPEDCRY